MFGVSVGLACNIRVAAPATTGVAIEVPLRYIILRVFVRTHASVQRRILGDEQIVLCFLATIFVARATRSGLIK